MLGRVERHLVYAHIKDEFGGSYATSIIAFRAAAQRLLGRRTELSEPNQPEPDEFEPNRSLNRRCPNDDSRLLEWLKWELHAD